MANMSYCRFENTLSDLKDCEGALEEIAEEGDTLAESDLSTQERRAAIRLIEVCENITKLAVELLSDHEG